jgi:ABC-type multidrug transport system ATPase subunit
MLDRNLRLRIFNKILNDSDGINNLFKEEIVIQFLSKIFDLKQLPSEDSRFANALEDAIQHVVNNNDWEASYLFTSRFNVIDDELLFIKFVETIVSPEFQKNKDSIISAIDIINIELSDSPQKLNLIEYFDGLPVFKFGEKRNSINLPLEIPENPIPFFFNSTPNAFPSFELKFRQWNDFGIRTLFDLHFNKDKNSSYEIGPVKILKNGSKNTSTEISELFYSLSYEFCSLGQEAGYYSRLRKYLGDDIYSVLLALKDVSAFPKIHELFEELDDYKTSLIRSNEAERLSRAAKYLMQGKSENEYFNFSYIHKSHFSANQIALNFNFDAASDYERRVFAIIGKNGCGKTQIMASLAKDLSKKKKQLFFPHMPIFGKVITISYSHFDRFHVPDSDAQFNYVYCGLKKGTIGYKSDDEMKLELLESADKIIKNNLYQQWVKILSQFFPPDKISFFKVNSTVESSRVVNVFDRDTYNQLQGKFSSGESIILQLISKILSEIRFNSLLIFDEPETHLHPNAISSLVNAIYEITEQFKSFCIFATHSPIIIQEIPAKNIAILERDEGVVNIRFLENESLGENLTVITQEIFGGKEISQNFTNQISNLAKSGKTKEEISNLIMSDNRPLSLTVALHINSLTKQDI